jgi:thiol-disulfide isomerase/thioredoxin
MRKLSAFIVLALASVSFGADSADVILNKARAEAKAYGKNVLVVFHASWCGWCHRFDKFVDTTEEGKLVKSGLVVTHLTVLESPNKKADENAGGLAKMVEWGGKDAGLPFMAILDAKTGKLIVNSLQKAGDTKTNTGYPAAPEEIAHFLVMLQKGATKISKENVSKIGAWLTANAPK